MLHAAAAAAEADDLTRPLLTDKQSFWQAGNNRRTHQCACEDAMMRLAVSVLDSTCEISAVRDPVPVIIDRSSTEPEDAEVSVAIGAVSADTQSLNIPRLIHSPSTACAACVAPRVDPPLRFTIARPTPTPLLVSTDSLYKRLGLFPAWSPAKCTSLNQFRAPRPSTTLAGLQTRFAASRVFPTLEKSPLLQEDGVEGVHPNRGVRHTHSTASSRSSLNDEVGPCAVAMRKVHPSPPARTAHRVGRA